MLKKLKITGFKSIRLAELTFGHSNLFIGANGAGKSNVLEALGVLSSALSRGLEPAVLADRGVRLSLPRLFKSAFRGKPLSPHLRLEAEFEFGHYECSIRAGLSSTRLEFHSETLFDGQRKVFGRGPNGTMLNRDIVEVELNELKNVDSVRSVWDIVSPFSEISPGFRAELEEFSKFAIFSPQTAVMRGLATERSVVQPLGLSGSGLAAAFREVVRSRLRKPVTERRAMDQIVALILSPGWIENILVGRYNTDVVPPEVTSEGLLMYFRDRFMTDKRNLLSAYDASEGTLYLAFVATLLLHEGTPKVFALDNVDGTLNPSLVRKLTDTVVNVCAQKSKKFLGTNQAFLTSHHPSSVDSFDIFNSSHKIYTVQRDAMFGSTEFTPILAPAGVDKDEWVQRKKGRTMSELWLAGQIPGALK